LGHSALSGSDTAEEPLLNPAHTQMREVLMLRQQTVFSFFVVLIRGSFSKEQANFKNA
jgi:hypothetical protein